MQMKPSIGTVVGLSDESHWGQILMTPGAYGVLEIFDAEGMARQKGVHFLNRLSERLNTSVTSLDVLSRIAEAESTGNVETLCLLVPIGMTVLIVFVGTGAVYLKRDNELACLLDGQGAISGELQSNDTLLFVSKSLMTVFSREQLLTGFDHLPAPDIAEKLTLLIHTSGGGVGGASLVFQVKETVPFEEEVMPKRSLPPVPVSIIWRLPKISVLAHNNAVLSAASARGKHLVRRIKTKYGNRNGALLALSLLFFGMFLISVVLGIRKQFQDKGQFAVNQSVIQAQHFFDEGVALVELNPMKGRERLTEAKGILDQLTATVSANSKAGRQIKDLSAQVNDRLMLAMQVSKGEPQLFYDAALLKKGASISSMALSDMTLSLLDGQGKTIYILAIDSKSGQVIGGGEQFGNAKLIAISGENVYILTGEGIHMIRITDKKTIPLVIKKDSEWASIGGLVAFGGNLYLLDTGKSRVWKYVSTGEDLSGGRQGVTPSGTLVFSDRKEYLNPDTLSDFTFATTMAIDGSVWVSTHDGKILRFTQGKENTFIAKGVTPAFGNDLSLYTSDAVTHVYILDREKKRIVMLDKDGTYVAQYTWEGGLSPTQLVVSESQKKIFLLADGKIYTLELK